MIELLGLNKSFGNQKVLNDINLFIQEGEIFGIIGQSGAGKSTLLRCINLLECPESGAVLVDGEEITKLNSKKLRQARQKMAMIFQHFNILNSNSVYENIALPLKIQGNDDKQIRSKVTELLEVVELADKAQAYPSELSGGQKQRVAIARALSTSPKILLCDEATSALDPKTTASILQLLKKINSLYGLTIIMITHEMSVVKQICHRLALMEKGKIIETTSIATAILDDKSHAKPLLFVDLNPKLPECLANSLVDYATEKPILRLYFQGKEATVPFISQTSRELDVNINILLANIDRFDTITCGVIVVELVASPILLDKFIEQCGQFGINVEILGYVNNNVI